MSQRTELWKYIKDHIYMRTSAIVNLVYLSSYVYYPPIVSRLLSIIAKMISSYTSIGVCGPIRIGCMRRDMNHRIMTKTMTHDTHPHSNPLYTS